jgi:dienelactone hydrolase
MAVLAIHPRPGQMMEELDAYGLIPAGVTYLSQSEAVDANRIAAVGNDLGGDLVIRALTKGQGLLAGVALAPRLGEEELGRGLPLLREMTLPRALRWTFGSRARQVAESLGGKPYLSEPETHNLLIVHGEQDGMVPLGGVEKALSAVDSSPQLLSIGGEHHLSLCHSLPAVRQTCGWLDGRVSKGEQE